MFKRIILPVLALFAAMIFVVIGCEGDAGPAGADGTAECVNCHNDDTQIVAIAAQWEASTHGSGSTFERNGPDCTGCHTSEGFVARMETGEVVEPVNPSRIGCFTCHQAHSNYTFELRTVESVALNTGGTFNLGSGNLCANCHQMRVPDPDLSGTSIVITSSYWGPHHGPQSNVLSGQGAYEFAGSSYGSSGHGTVVTDGCSTCHMAAPYGDQAGGHTFNLSYAFHGSTRDLIAGCETAGCHSTIDDFNHNGVQDSVVVLLDSLKILLMAEGLLDDSDHVIPDSTGTAIDDAGAVFNYLVMLEDRSWGVHNTAYTYDVLNETITYLAP